MFTLAVEASWKPIHNITYHFQDRSAAIAIRYENYAEIIMF